MARRNKYGARKTVVDGITFDSLKEARRYGELKALENAGKITGLELQPAFPIVISGKPVRYPRGKSGRLGRVITYKADFEYFDFGRDKVVIEDAKGFATKEYKIKRALVEHTYGIEIEEV